MKIDKPEVIEIEKIVDESKDTKTFLFKYKLDAKPGQFVMLWIPRVDEKPFSISFQDNERFAITVFKVGPFTEKLFKLNEGDKVGIRGPYGHGFTVRKGKVVLVGGGCGTAPLGLLADELKKAGAEVNFIIGGRSKENLLYLERMNKAEINTLVATDDGSFGVKGFTTDILKNFIENNEVDMVYACGPEPMLKPVAEICIDAKIPCEVSLERYMKCGFGLCGQCCIDNTGARICKEGPVFNAEQALQLHEFSKYKRTASGKKVGKWQC